MAANGSVTSSKPQFLLHTYYKSSCSGRLRIALNLKGLQAEYVYVHLYHGDQLSEKYRELNPSGTVPVLTHLDEDGNPISFPITQSTAALEYLEEAYPNQRPLLPPTSKPLERAKSEHSSTSSQTTFSPSLIVGLSHGSRIWAPIEWNGTSTS